jgi:hypothetical protein
VATLFTIHAVVQAKLEGVVAEMAVMGSPRIRAVNCGDYLMALEGVHRIAAAAQLGVALDLEILEQNDLVAADSLDWADLCSGQSYTAGELAGEAYSPSCGIYRLNDDDTVEAV